MEKSEESPENKETIWRQWFREYGGIYWTVPKNMPDAARDPWNDYCHYRNNSPTENSALLQAKAAEEFKKATGFDAEEVHKFKESLEVTSDRSSL